jgi:H/ACA ribonucleoprotein complex subunit 3
MQVLIDGKTVKLGNKNVIGSGGEATIFKHGGCAVKIYQTLTPERDGKLRDLVNVTNHLPPEVIAPQQLVFEKSGQHVVGFTMRLLSADYTEARKLATKNFRAQSGIMSREVATLFLNAHRTLTSLHQAGVVVGDFNDLNLMFRDQNEMLFIDVDSFQFGQHPCMVGTEAFLAPELYGVDLSGQPHFQPEHDWYSFAVMLFKSLLLVHPYGGVHPRLKLLTHRAQQGVSAFDPDVKYPRIAYRPELLSDDLAQVFDDWFTRGQRGVFPANAISDYIMALKVCPSCQATYPQNRSQCPVCAKSVPVVLPSTQMAGAQTLIRMGGQAVAWYSDGSVVAMIAHEAGQAVLYRSDGKQATPQRLELFKALPTATYAFMGDKLIVSPSPDSEDLMVLDVSGTEPNGLLKTTTDQYGGTQPMFGANGRSSYRLAGGYLMRGQFKYGQLVESAVIAVTEGQTWFQVAPDREQVFGLFRVVDSAPNAATFSVHYRYWLLNDEMHVDAALTPLDQNETLIEINAKFSRDSVLVARLTQLNGVERIRLDEIDPSGRLIHSQIRADVEGFTPLNAHAYAPGVLLRADDSGIIQEWFDTGASKTFTQAEPFARRGDAIAAYQKGLLVIQSEGAIYLKV